jgi:hypothetical protein
VDEDDDVLPDVIRSPEEVAWRSLALFAVVGRALGAPSEEIAAWLTENDLWPHLTEREIRFVAAEQSDPKERIDFTWQSERLIVLLWAMNKIETLPSAAEQCDTSVFQNILPPYAEIGVLGFIDSVKLRPDDELTEMAKALLDLHWHARDGKLNNRRPRKPVDLGVAQERHHAINWVTGYCALSWDEVTTDT